MWIPLRLGALIRWRRKAGLVLTALALALPTIIVTLAFTADYVSRPSGEQYASAVMGSMQGEAKLVTMDAGTPEHVLNVRRQAESHVRSADPGAISIFTSRQVVVGTPSGGHGAVLFARPWTPEVLSGDWLLMVGGRMPDGLGEAALSPGEAQALGVAVGDAVTLYDKSLTVVGIAQRAQALKSLDVFTTPDQVADAPDWVLEPSWLLTKDEVDLGPDFVVRTRAQIVGSGTSLAAKMPAPLVFGSLALLVVVMLLMRVLDRDAELLLAHRLSGLGLSRWQQAAAKAGGLLLTVLAAAAITSSASAAGVWLLRERVWQEGVRVPPPMLIPWVLLSAAAATAAVLAVFSLLVPLRDTGAVVVGAGTQASSATRTLQRASLRTDVRRIGRWGAAAVAGGSLLVTGALTLLVSIETMNSKGDIQGYLPGQIRVISSDGIHSPATHPLFPDAMVDQIREALGVEVRRVQRLRVAGLGHDAYENNVFAAKRGARGKVVLLGGIQLIRDATDFAWWSGREITTDQQRALDDGHMLTMDTARTGVGDLADLAESTAKKPVLLATGITVTPIPSDETIAPSSPFIVGPSFVAAMSARGVDIVPYTDMLLTAPGGDDSDATMATVSRIVGEYGFSPTVVKRNRPPLDGVGQAARTAVALLASFALATLIVMGASLAVAGRRRDRLLNELGATAGSRWRLAVANPVRVQGIRALFGAAGGLLLVAAISPAMGLHVGLIVEPALVVVAVAVAVVASTSTIFWMTLTRRNR